MGMLRELRFLLLFHFLCKTLYKLESLNMPPPLAYLAHHFEYSQPTNGKKTGKAKCLWCQNYNKAINSTQKEKHLMECPSVIAGELEGNRKDFNTMEKQRGRR
jgi:hypothetical protein